MELDEIIAICGPKCSECEAYKATRNGREDLKRVALKWSKDMGREFTPEDIVCDGCRVKDGRLSVYCSTCVIRLCAQSNGFETCAHCNRCPCERIIAPPAIESLNNLKLLLSGKSIIE